MQYGTREPRFTRTNKHDPKEREEASKRPSQSGLTFFLPVDSSPLPLFLYQPNRSGSRSNWELGPPNYIPTQPGEPGKPGYTHHPLSHHPVPSPTSIPRHQPLRKLQAIAIGGDGCALAVLFTSYPLVAPPRVQGTPSEAIAW